MTEEDEAFNEIERRSKEKTLQALHNENERLGLYKRERTWVGLTDQEVELVYAIIIKIRKKDIMPGEQKMFARTIEAKLKEKNT